jgi:ABC-2 type transport system ATP-binding protein
MNILEIKKLEKTFGEIKAIDGISFGVKEGEIYGLLGPNGAGKSTAINIICGLLKKEKGTIDVFSKSIDKDHEYIKSNIGVVPQEIAIYPDLTAVENIKFFASLYGIKGKLLNERADEALEFVGLTDRKNDYPSKFSGGMKRRLNIACAIAHHPKLIIMDEPTVGIDPQSRNHILDSVKKLNENGSTIIYTTHYMEEVEAIATKVGIIDHGKLIAEGSINELQNLISDRKTVDIVTDLGTEVNLDELGEIKGVLKVNYADNKISVESLKESDNLHQITKYLSNNDIPIREIGMSTVSLESIFLSLTGRSLRD